MNRGPQKQAQRADMVARASASWSGSAPDWVLALAEACNASSQAAVGKRIGYSPATVSQVISASYAGDLGRVEGMVRGALMLTTIDCPIKGEMRRNVCLEWQAKPYAATSSDRVRMFHACRGGCPFSNHTKGDDTNA